MSNFQQLTIVGHVGRLRDLKYTQNGIALFGFTVAVNARKDAPPTWFDVTVWRDQAETCVKYVRPGMQVLVMGSVKARAYIGRDGQPAAELDVDANRVVFLSKVEDQPESGQPELMEDINF